MADKRIVLSNSQLARPFSIASWTKVRIALRLIMTNTGANISSASFWVGLSSGTTNLIMDATTDNWCGIVTATGASAAPVTMVYGTSPSRYKYSSNVMAAKRVGSTATSNSSTIDSADFMGLKADATLAHRSLLFVDITRGSPNYTINAALAYDYWSAGTGDATLADFLLQAETASPSHTNHVAGTAKTLAVDESTGAFNAVNIGWNKTSPTIEICDLAVVKLA